MKVELAEPDTPFMKVLVVEDEPASVEHVLLKSRRAIKGTNGIFVHEFATSISEASERITESFFDLCVIDMGLPDAPKGSFYEDGGERFIRMLQNGEFGEDKIDTKFLIVTGQDLVLNQAEFDKREGCIGVYSKLSFRNMAQKVESFYKELITEALPKRHAFNYINHSDYYVEIMNPGSSGCLPRTVSINDQRYKVCSDVASFQLSTKKPVRLEDIAEGLLLEEPYSLKLEVAPEVKLLEGARYGAVCLFESEEIGTCGEDVFLDNDDGSFTLMITNGADFIDPGVTYVEQKDGEQKEGKWSLRSSGVVFVVEAG